MRRILLAASLLATLLAPLTAFAQAPPAVPALPDSERRTAYSLTGSTCGCAVNFALYGEGSDVDSWIEVWINGVQYLSTDSNHGWSLSSVTGSLATIPRPITDAVLTFNVNQTGTLQIVGARRPRQLSQFTEGRGVAARDLNQRFTDDRAVMRELWDKTNDLTGRGLFFAPGNTTGPMPQPSACVGAFLNMGSNGLTPTCLTAAGLGIIGVPTNTTVGDIVTWGNAAGTVLSDSGNVLKALTLNGSGISLPAFVGVAEPVLTLSGAQDANNTGETIANFDSFGANANGTITFFKSGGGGDFTGSVSGTVMTITAVTTGSLAVNQIVQVAGVPTGTTIASLGTGSGGIGTYNLSAPGTVAGGSLILTNDSPAHPTETQDGQILGLLVGQGWVGSSVAREAGGSAYIVFEAEPGGGNWTSNTNAPGRIRMTTRPIGSSTDVDRLYIDATGEITERQDSVGASSPTLGFTLRNFTAAANGAQQNSPSLHWRGSAWDSSGLASEPVEWISSAAAVQGGPPTTTLVWSSQINSGGWITQARLTSGGIFNVTSGFQIASAAPSGHVPRGNGTNYVDGQLSCSDLSPACIASGGTAGGDLTGTYPNPTIANISTAATVPGYLDWTQTSAPANPASGHDRTFMSSGDVLKVLNSSGNISLTAVPISGVSHQWLSALSNSGVFTQSQPAFTDISGTLSATQCPAPSASTIGCIESYAAVSHQWINTISVAGVPSSSQPQNSDLSDVTQVGSWTPSDQSGQSLVFTNVSTSYQRQGNLIFIYGRFSFPSTANGSAVSIGGLPVTVANQNYASAPGPCNSNGTIGIQAQPNKNATTFFLLNTVTGASITNANMSLQTVNCTFFYPAS